jgi:hypothetical protein
MYLKAFPWFEAHLEDNEPTYFFCIKMYGVHLYCTLRTSGANPGIILLALYKHEISDHRMNYELSK